jgi:hypothetical protein
MEDDQPYAVVMIEGRLKTTREMRSRSTGILPLEKLEAAIESLERSQEMLIEALEQPQPNSFGLDPMKISDYLTEVMNELEIFQTQRTLLHEETHGIVSNIPKHVVDPPFPSGPVYYGNAAEKFVANTNLAHLLKRAELWNLPLHAEGPNLDTVHKISICIPGIVSFHEAREYLKRMFWIRPEWRIDTAYLIYHYYCGWGSDKAKTYNLFKDWLICTLNQAITPDLYPDILHSSMNHEYLPSIDELKIPFDPSTEALLMNLLWLSIPQGELLTIAHLQCGILDKHYSSHFDRLQKLLEFEDPLQ